MPDASEPNEPAPPAEPARSADGGGGGSSAWTPAILVAAIAAGLAALFWLGGSVPAPLEPGDPAPAFELPGLDPGQAVGLEDLAGQVVLVNFWATDCPPCVAEMPSMERLHRSLEGRGFALVAISGDAEREPVEAFRERFGLTFPILLDPDREISRLYQTTGFPETILVAPDGRVVERYVGAREWDDPLYQERIRALLPARGSRG